MDGRQKRVPGPLHHTAKKKEYAMGKHSKNNNDRPFFSNAERKAAAQGRAASAFTGANDFREWGWGTETRTLDSDSMKDLDACSLSLQPCAEPYPRPYRT